MAFKQRLNAVEMPRNLNDFVEFRAAKSLAADISSLHFFAL